MVELAAVGSRYFDGPVVQRVRSRNPITTPPDILHTGMAVDGRPVAFTVMVENVSDDLVWVGMFIEGTGRVPIGHVAKSLGIGETSIRDLLTPEEVDEIHQLTPVAVAVPPREKTWLRFAWTPRAPQGKKWFRGRLVLRELAVGGLVESKAISIEVHSNRALDAHLSSESRAGRPPNQ